MRVSVPQLLALRKGSYLVSDQDQEICCFEFLASVELMRPRTLSDISDHGHSPERSPKENSLRVGQTVVCHVANVRQTVLIKEIAGMDGTVLNKLHSASNGMIKFKFINHPELIQPQRYADSWAKPNSNHFLVRYYFVMVVLVVLELSNRYFQFIHNG